MRTFVGFGFGPIQAGLFALEAFRSGRFARIVIAEVVRDLVLAVRRTGGTYAVNVAGRDGLQTVYVRGVEMRNPCALEDAQALVAAIAEATDIATALPSVSVYTCGTPSPADLLARGLHAKLDRRQPVRTVVYTGENHTQAAQLLESAVRERLPSSVASILSRHVQFLNTVIGKMSGVSEEVQRIGRGELTPIVLGWPRAFVVEAFNQILVSAITLRRFQRGIEVFTEKPDLLPFEEAKLYGHNAIHALIGYRAYRLGYTLMSEAGRDPALMAWAREAFLEECGPALQFRHAGKDELFTAEGFRRYADDLLERMTNPWLADRVDRVIRDPQRKLGWDDRMVGTMRRALDAGVKPHRLASAAADALWVLDPTMEASSAREWMAALWAGARDEPPGRKAVLMDLIAEAIGTRAGGEP